MTGVERALPSRNLPVVFTREEAQAIITHLKGENLNEVGRNLNEVGRNQLCCKSRFSCRPRSGLNENGPGASALGVRAI